MLSWATLRCNICFPDVCFIGWPYLNFFILFRWLNLDLVLIYKDLENTDNDNINICFQEEVTKFETCLRQHNVWFWFILSVGLKKLWDEDDFEQRRHALHAWSPFSRSMNKNKLQICNLLPSGIECKQQKDQEKMLPISRKGKVYIFTLQPFSSLWQIFFSSS